MANSEDTEITLGTGKMLAIFFGLVALCAVFFGMGFSLGKNSAPNGVAANSTASTPRSAAVKPSSSAASPDLSFYKTVGQKQADTSLPANAAPDTNAPPSESQSAATDPAAAPPLNGYYVQVAAVRKEEDAQALVEALKKKQYAAFATSLQADKLFHVQIGPFGDIKDAEGTRAKLVGDGYNPILKK